MTASTSIQTACSKLSKITLTSVWMVSSCLASLGYLAFLVYNITTSIFFVASPQEQSSSYPAVITPITVPVVIQVQCPSAQWHWTNLSLPALALAASALEQSYQQVYASLDGGDSFLAEVHLNHISIVVPHNVTTATTTTTGMREMAVYSANFGCTLCEGEGVLAMEKKEEWEQLYLSLLRRSVHQSFHTLQDPCTISLQEDVDTVPRSSSLLSLSTVTSATLILAQEMDSMTVGEDSIPSDIFLQASCSGLDFTHLNPEQIHYSARALQETYNDWHEQHPEMDPGVVVDFKEQHHPARSRLYDVQFLYAQATKTLHRYQRGWGWMVTGIYTGMISHPDKYFRNKLPGMRVWETMWAEKMREQPDFGFEQVRACHITIKPMRSSNLNPAGGHRMDKIVREKF